jgi:DNA-nicking Smr family endonuclease
MSDSAPPPYEYPITDELDLHTFRPADLGELIPAYLEAARDRGYRQVRIIHGKGTGTLRTTVHALLARSPLVAAHALAPPEAGGWGATRVTLRPPSA